MTSAEHNKFRTTIVWKRFRTKLLEERQYRCECCGIKKKKGLQIHHKRPDKYTELEIHDDFVLLCADCHATTEKLMRRFRGKKKDTIYNPELWLALFGPFFSIETPTDESEEEI